MVLTYEINLFKDQEILKRFKTNETNFSVVQGKISALITEAELIELQGGGVTMYNRLGKAEMNIRGLYLNFSDLSTKYNSITGQYEQYDAKLADFEFSLDGFRSELSETHTTITNTSNRINGLSQTLANDYWTSTTTTTQMNAAIKQAIDEISLSVSKTYVTSTTYESLTTRVSKAELKITEDAIVSTVRESTLYTNDLNGKVNSSSIISTINQSAESILIQASKLQFTAEKINAAIAGSNKYYQLDREGISMYGIMGKTNVMIGSITTAQVTNSNLNGLIDAYVSTTDSGTTYQNGIFLGAGPRCAYVGLGIKRSSNILSGAPYFAFVYSRVQMSMKPNSSTIVYKAGSLNANVKLDMHGNEIIDPAWVTYDGSGVTNGFTGEIPFVQITSMSSDGTAAYWYNNCYLRFRRGVLVYASVNYS